MLLTTHFMEEADVLGDRVAALHDGRLRALATPLFLKKMMGRFPSFFLPGFCSLGFGSLSRRVDVEAREQPWSWPAHLSCGRRS